MIHRKCHLIYNGLKSPSFIDRENARRFIAEKIEKHSSFFDGKQAVGSIGELTKNKGYGRAIEAFSKTPEGMVYIIVGNGELYNELARQIKNNNLGEKIFLTGFLDNASSLLKAFDIFLLPSIKEGLPYVLLEAGYAGLPVIAAAVGGVPEIIEDQKTGVLAAPDNASDLTQKLSELAANTPFKEKIARAFQEKVGKNFSLEQMLSDTIKLYEADHFVRR
ncbi:MAG: Glycosyl transferase group 1 [Parcubacteria group bacterium GW2011_GWB1_44_7]|nr:MAG: Glycosyl transferase group 1 [Parcubacteria group bacterium GW2011_GWB1_44_7]